MGIQGLLPLLKSITKAQVHVRRYSGRKVAVDAYGWLHKAAYCCAYELCEGIYTDRFVGYCMSRIHILQHAGVIPIIVFDGGKLPMKSAEEDSRGRNRKENLEKARAHWQAGNTTAAYDSYQKAVDISPATAKQFIEALKAANVEFIVAPYEADAQMAYLALNGLVHAVITEDSDMLAYGCPRVLFKMDKNGEGQEICMADLPECRNPSFAGFTPDMFLEMCILAGCDFLKALSSIGIKKAHGHIRKYKTFIRVCKCLRFSGVGVPREYETGFQRALWTFRHQRVFCPATRKLVHLRPLPPGGLADGVLVLAALPSKGEADLPFLGPVLPDAMAEAIATGDLDPITKEPFPEPIPRPVAQGEGMVDDPSRVNPRRSQHRRRSAGTRKSLPVHANGIANYFKVLPVSKEAQRDFAAPRMFPVAEEARLERADSKGSLDQSVSEAGCATPADQGSESAPDETPAERASSHGMACSSQPELPKSSRRTLHLSRFSCGTGGSGVQHAGRQPISMPARIGHRRPETPSDTPGGVAVHEPARHTYSSDGLSPVLPTSSNTTLDFTTPLDTAATGVRTAGASREAVVYITEEHITLSEMGMQSADGGRGSYGDVVGWQESSSRSDGRQMHIHLDADACGCASQGANRRSRLVTGGRPEAGHTGGELRTVLSSLQQESQAELEEALQTARETDMECVSADGDVDFVPETAAKGSADIPVASMLQGISPAGRLGFQDLVDNNDAALACALGREELECGKDVAGACRQNAFLEGLRSPQVEDLSGNHAAEEARLVGITDSAEPGCNADALGLACSPRVPAWGGMQQPVSLWAAHYEGPDILLEAEGSFQQPACPAKCGGSVSALSDDDDLLSPIHRHPLALDIGHYGPGHKGGLFRRVGAGKRARSQRSSPVRKQRHGSPENTFSAESLQLPTSPTVGDAVFVSGAGTGSPGVPLLSSARRGSGADVGPMQLGSPNGRHQAGGGGCSVLQELSNEAHQQEADLERLLTPLKSSKPGGAGMRMQLAAPDEDADMQHGDFGNDPMPASSIHDDDGRHASSTARRTNSARLNELDQGIEQQSSGSEGEEEEDAQEGDAFHSLRHVKPFAKEAARALDLVEVAARKGAHRKRAPCVPLRSAKALRQAFDPPRTKEPCQQGRQKTPVKAGACLFEKYKCATKTQGR
ncbi:probable exonuclease 1 at N-terminal half [Coccomyxa sp. Obi]|nr:probable exonuclease 1 at N-terminal half [Coccomyxa sp. Obi]